jgi:predicted DNA-binding protein with PD1-like motif
LSVKRRLLMRKAVLQPGQVVVLHLDEGEDLLKSLREHVRAMGLHDAVFLTAIGTLRQARVHMVTDCGFPPTEYIWDKTGPFEVLALQGFIANGDIHAHLTLSDQHRAFGGHLEEGTIVQHMCDLALQVLGGETRLVRRKEPVKNLLMLQFEPRQEGK